MLHFEKKSSRRRGEREREKRADIDNQLKTKCTLNTPANERQKKNYLTLAYSRNGMFELAMQTHNKRRQQQQQNITKRKICVRIGGTK